MVAIKNNTAHKLCSGVGVSNDATNDIRNTNR